MTNEEYWWLKNRKAIPWEEWGKYFLPAGDDNKINKNIRVPKIKMNVQDFSRYKELYKEANDLPSNKFEKFKRDNNLPDDIDLRC